MKDLSLLMETQIKDLPEGQGKPERNRIRGSFLTPWTECLGKAEWVGPSDHFSASDPRQRWPVGKGAGKISGLRGLGPHALLETPQASGREGRTGHPCRAGSSEVKLSKVRCQPHPAWSKFLKKA